MHERTYRDGDFKFGRSLYNFFIKRYEDSDVGLEFLQKAYTSLQKAIKVCTSPYEPPREFMLSEPNIVDLDGYVKYGVKLVNVQKPEEYGITQVNNIIPQDPVTECIMNQKPMVELHLEAERLAANIGGVVESAKENAEALVSNVSRNVTNIVNAVNETATNMLSAPVEDEEQQQGMSAGKIILCAIAAGTTLYLADRQFNEGRIANKVCHTAKWVKSWFGSEKGEVKNDRDSEFTTRLNNLEAELINLKKANEKGSLGKNS